MASEWWHTGLTGDLIQGIPWAPADEDAVIDLMGREVEIYELACGIGDGEDEKYLRQVLNDYQDTRFWHLTHEGMTLGWLVCSVFTTRFRLYVYFDPAAKQQVSNWDDAWPALWMDGVEVLSSAVFEHEPTAESVFLHLPLPLDETIEGCALRLGFEPIGDELMRMPRAIFRLERHVYTLYHEDVSDLDDA